MCYFRQSLTWKKDGEYAGENFERFVKIWNENEGSASKTSAEFGTNDWGELLLTPQNVKQRAKDIAKSFGDKNPLCDALDEKVSGLDVETVANIIAELDI